MEKTYISGGKLGDFIQQMSVIYEKYLSDNIPAVLYIVNKGDDFRHGVETAYKDLYDIVSIQPYIKEFKIYNGEPYDIDLSEWRKHTNPFWHGDNYLGWMKKEYDVDWGKNKWLLNIPTDPVWENKIVINTTRNRFPTMIDWNKIFEENNKDEFVFVGFEQEDYNHFTTCVREIPVYYVSSLNELCVIINSCKTFIGSLSSPLSLAFGLHAPLIIGLYNNPFDFPAFSTMGKNIPSII